MPADRDPSALHRARARAALEIARPAVAARAARAALAHDPRDAEALVLLSLALTALDALSAACAAAQQSIALDPGCARAHFALAWALYRIEAYHRALEPASRAVDLAPRDADAHALLAAIVAGTGRRVRATACADRAAALADDAPFVLAVLTGVYERCGELDRAEAMARRLLVVGGGDAPAYARLAMILRSRARAAEAVDAARAAVRVDPNCAQAWQALGFAQNAVGPMGAGVSSFKEALRLARRAAAARPSGSQPPRVPPRVARWLGMVCPVTMGLAVLVLGAQALRVATGVGARNARVDAIAHAAVAVGFAGWFGVAFTIIMINAALARWWSRRGPRSLDAPPPL